MKIDRNEKFQNRQNNSDMLDMIKNVLGFFFSTKQKVALNYVRVCVCVLMNVYWIFSTSVEINEILICRLIVYKFSLILCLLVLPSAISVQIHWVIFIHIQPSFWTVFAILILSELLFSYFVLVSL